jgi:hypothetical protein
MFYSRPLQIALLFVCGVTAVSAKEPGMVLGAGASTCGQYLNFKKDPKRVSTARMMFSWVQGYFSARNAMGHTERMLTVGGSVSADTLESMLADQCTNEGESTTVWIAADDLYDKLRQKGM